jgi:hypothetical protein
MGAKVKPRTLAQMSSINVLQSMLGAPHAHHIMKMSGKLESQLEKPKKKKKKNNEIHELFKKHYGLTAAGALRMLEEKRNERLLHERVRGH